VTGNLENFCELNKALNEKTQNSEVIDIDNIYKFCIKNIFIKFYKRKYDFIDI